MTYPSPLSTLILGFYSISVMDMAQSLQPASLPRSASLKSWIATSGSILGAFMAILDVSVTNASLQDIQGVLSATLGEGAWFLKKAKSSDGVVH